VTNRKQNDESFINLQNHLLINRTLYVAIIDLMMSNIMNLSRNQHVILLYENNTNRDLASAECINQGLKEKQLCVYASVNTHDKSQLSNISSQITGYEENIRKRNLLLVDLKSFYDSALVGDLTPFKEFKMQLQQELVHRGTDNNKDVLIIADCADNLFITNILTNVKWLRIGGMIALLTFTAIIFIIRSLAHIMVLHLLKQPNAQ